MPGSTGEWKMRIQEMGYMCAKCYGEHEHSEDTKGAQAKEYLSEAEFLRLLEEEMVGATTTRSTVHRRKMMEAMVVECAKAEAMLERSRKEMKKVDTQHAMECLALKMFAHVLSAEAGKKKAC